MNKSGLKPVAHRILVKPDPVEERTKSGLILKTEQTVEQERWAQVKGTLVDMGAQAFTAPFSETERDALKPGARVYFRKFEGIIIEGADGEEYRLCTDTDVGGVVLDEGAVATIQRRDRTKFDAKRA